MKPEDATAGMATAVLAVLIGLHAIYYAPSIDTWWLRILARALGIGLTAYGTGLAYTAHLIATGKRY